MGRLHSAVVFAGLFHAASSLQARDPKPITPLAATGVVSAARDELTPRGHPPPADLVWPSAPSSSFPFSRTRIRRSQSLYTSLEPASALRGVASLQVMRRVREVWPLAPSVTSCTLHRSFGFALLVFALFLGARGLAFLGHPTPRDDEDSNLKIALPWAHAHAVFAMSSLALCAAHFLAASQSWNTGPSTALLSDYIGRLPANVVVVAALGKASGASCADVCPVASLVFISWSLLAGAQGATDESLSWILGAAAALFGYAALYVTSSFTEYDARHLGVGMALDFVAGCWTCYLVSWLTQHAAVVSDGRAVVILGTVDLLFVVGSAYIVLSSPGPENFAELVPIGDVEEEQ